MFLSSRNHYEKNKNIVKILVELNKKSMRVILISFYLMKLVMQM